jgi:hypothetical protein
MGCHASTPGALVVLLLISAMAVRRVSRRRARAESGPRGLMLLEAGALVVVDIMRARAWLGLGCEGVMARIRMKGLIMQLK